MLIATQKASEINMNRVPPLYSHSLLVGAYILFFAVIAIVLVPHWMATQEQNRKLTIVEEARAQAERVMPPYKDNWRREYYWTLTGSVHYRLEMNGTHEAVVWLGEPEEGSSYLRVSMCQIGDGAWSARKAQMFIDPKDIVQDQHHLLSLQMKPHRPVAQ